MAGGRTGEGASTARPRSGAAFSYHRGIAPMMWVLLGLMLVEAGVMHLLIALWSVRIALALSILSLSAAVWLILLIRSLAQCPVLLADGMLTWRCGNLRRVDLPLSQIAGLRADWDRPLVRARDTFNGALIAHPNIMIDLHRPVRAGRREIVRLAHRLDDPEAFVAALAGLRGEA